MAISARFTAATGNLNQRLRGPGGGALPPPTAAHVLCLLQRIDSKLGGVANRMIQFVAASPEDSTSTVATAYAAASSERARRSVLLLNGPGGGTAPGLVETILAGRPLSDSLAAKTTRLAAARLLGDGALAPHLNNAEFWTTLRESFDELVVDGGAVSNSRTALLTAERADAVLVVVRADRTHRDSLTRLLDDLAAVNAPVLGMVLTNRTDPVPRFVRNWF